MDAEVASEEEDYLAVTLADGSRALVNPAGDFSPGDRAQIVIRAQKMVLGYETDMAKEPGLNYFFGTIVDRSYMGGEVSYFVELPSKQVLHVINFVKRSPFRRGEAVYIQVDPYHCRLLGE